MYVCNTIAEHTCKCPGCKEVLVIDGNMKNWRDVCMAKDAGYIQYLGLPGHIKSGYTLSLNFMSRYCQNHAQRASMLHCTQEDTAVEMILEKKQHILQGMWNYHHLVNKQRWVQEIKKKAKVDI